MANPPCQFDDGNAAVFIGTNFDTGESVTLCPPCLVSWCATIVEGMTGVPVSALIDSLNQTEAMADALLGDDADGIAAGDEHYEATLDAVAEHEDADSTSDQ